MGPEKHPHAFLANSITIDRLRQTGNNVPAQSLSPGCGGFVFPLVMPSRGVQVCVFFFHHGRVSCTASSHYMFSECRLSYRHPHFPERLVVTFVACTAEASGQYGAGREVSHTALLPILALLRDLQ